MITKDNNYLIMELFFKYPSRDFHIRELSRLTGLSSTGIIKIVKRLKKEKLLISKKEKTVEIVNPSFEGRFTLIKRLHNINSLYETSLINKLKKYYEQPEAIILFGSYSKGEDFEKSDIDIAILTSKKDIPDLTLFEKNLARKINLHLLNKEKISEEFKTSLINGIVLEGYLML